MDKWEELQKAKGSDQRSLLTVRLRGQDWAGGSFSQMHVGQSTVYGSPSLALL